MTLYPKVPYSYELKTVDSHTMGEYTRILYEGCPPLTGNTVMEKKEFFRKNYDYIRTALMLEPRGHRDMFGAVLTEPTMPQADVGVFFLDSGGCLNMCGHGSIGVATMMVEMGMVPVTEPETSVTLETPAGLVRATIRVEKGKAAEVSIVNVPSFVYLKDQILEVEGVGAVSCDISFGGSFFALVDADKLGLSLAKENAKEISEVGMKILKAANQTLRVSHPVLSITSVDLTELYSKQCTSRADMKNCVVFGNAQIDRSPCGTGTSAKLAALHAKGKLEKNTPFRYESIIGSVFRGEILDTVDFHGYEAVIPRITGSAYIAGINRWYLDEDDPLKYGFSL